MRITDHMLSSSSSVMPSPMMAIVYTSTCFPKSMVPLSSDDVRATPSPSLRTATERCIAGFVSSRPRFNVTTATTTMKAPVKNAR
jgi:hypothetical protein